MSSQNPRPQDFIERSNVRGFSVLLLDWSVIFGVIAFSIWANNWIVYLSSVWIIGSFQYAIGESLFHEASHYNLFKTKKLNDYLEWLYAIPFFVDMTQYRKEHLDHHYKPGTDADHIVRDYEVHGLNNPEKNLFWMWFIKPVIGYAGIFYLRFCIQLNPPKSSIKFAIFWLPIVSIFWYFDSLHILALYWFVPFLWSFASFFYWAEVSEHHNTKSCCRSDVGFWKNLFHHNGGYHYIHHMYPTIPWYKLPEAHKALCMNEGDVSSGFLDTYRQMKKSG
ncbi:MAG: fatty acid desaturase [Nitrosopumilus sp.]|nr:MAG: fatty acid desaturase [Nitrosopumilus sp.]